MIEPWERKDVSDWPIVSIEQAGSNENLWLEDPVSNWHWLHKNTTVPANGVEQGEDWSEVLSTRVAAQLKIPCATARLCRRNGRRGSLSLSVIPSGYALWEGSVMLESRNAPGYFHHAEGAPAVDPARPAVKRPGHNLSNIHLTLDGARVPPGFVGPAELTAFDVFAGYTVLDALIANRDRHEQNWAVLSPQLGDDPPCLAPTYDHASSLAYNLTDNSRQRFLTDETRLNRWAAKGTAYRFEHEGRPPTLVDHAAQALALATPEGAHWWRERLKDCDPASIMEPVRDGV